MTAAFIPEVQSSPQQAYTLAQEEKLYLSVHSGYWMSHDIA